MTTMLKIKKRLVRDVASVTMDGVAPESGQDGPLREERHARGAHLEMLVFYFNAFTRKVVPKERDCLLSGLLIMTLFIEAFLLSY